jgi:hypothetical protein
MARDRVHVYSMHGTPRELVPMRGEPWLTLRSWVRPGMYVLLGTVICFLVLCVVGASLDPMRWPYVRSYVLFGLGAMVLGFVGTLGAIARRTSERENSQWCPDCFQAMTWGAHVCPFCGFRPTLREPGVPASRSPQRTGAAPS